jgi:hypothetical protein
MTRRSHRADDTDGRLVIDVTIPLRKVYRLPERPNRVLMLPADAPVTDGRPNGDA